MRALCTVLLFCALALGLSGNLRAADINVANAQQLVSAAKTATEGVFTDVSLSFNGKVVVFALFRDSVGNVTAKPKVGQDVAGITVSQVNIQMKANDKGLLTPVALVVQGSDGSVSKKMVTLTPDGNIASLDQPAVAVVADDKKDTKDNKDANKKDTKTDSTDPFASPFLSIAGGGQLPLPAGCESGKISVWQP